MRRIPAELIERYRKEGWWTPETLGDLLARGLRASPDAGFHVHSSVRPYAGTFGEVERDARRLAAGLRSRGVGPGDVVAIQLPNWREAAVAFWASSFLGAVIVPIVHFYGRKELAHILATARPRVFITASEFGRMRYQPDLCADIPIVGLVGESGELLAARAIEHRFDDLLADEPMDGTIAGRPGCPGADRLHLGHHAGPQGRDPQPSDPGLRDAPAARELPARPGTPADRDARGALHRHDRRVPDPGPGRRTDRSGRRLRSRPRCWR